jgi:DNA-binding beta-propeller fold protein YncE
MLRLRSALAGASIGLLLTAAGAQADCPGALPAGGCAYSGAGAIGERSGGVLRFPQAVAVGPDGAVYVADQKSHVIQVFNPDGSFRRDFGGAGSRPGQLSSAGGVAVAPDGSAFVAAGANRIDRFDAAGTFLRSFGRTGSEVGEFAFGSGGGNDAGAGGGIAIGPDGLLYVADSGNDRVQRFDLDGGHGAQIVAPGTLAYPMGIAVRKTRVLVADDQNHRIAVFDTGGRLLKTIGAGRGAGPGQLANPYDVAADAQGRVFVADDLNHRVVRFSTLPDYVYKARWGSYGTRPGQLAYPRGIAVDRGGNVYVANTGNDRIDVFDNAGRLLRSMGRSGRAPGQFDEPSGIAVDAAGIRAVTDSVNGRVQILGPDGAVLAVWGSPNPGPTILPDPVAAAFDGAGTLYVLDGRRARVLVFSRTTGVPVRTIGAPGSGPGQLADPQAIAVTAGGTISVADTGNERIARFAPDGTYLGAQTGVGDVRGIAVTPDGARTYVSTGSDNRIRAYDQAGTELAEFGGRGRTLGKLESPGQLSLDPAGNLWVADRGNARVQQFGPNGERLAAFGARGSATGQFIRPTSVAVDCRGTVTVADHDNNRVQQFALAVPPAATCATLPAPGVPPAPKVPTLPAPDGPVLTVKVLRRTSVLRTRSIPVKVKCDTACVLEASGTLTPAAAPPKPRKGKRAKPVVVAIAAKKRTLGAGDIATVKLTLSRTDARRLTKALRGRRAIKASVQLTATAEAGQPTARTLRLDARR